MITRSDWEFYLITESIVWVILLIGAYVCFYIENKKLNKKIKNSVKLKPL